MFRTYAELREELLTQIQAARREFWRLKSEIAALNPRLPQGIYIANYRSNYKWEYHSLGHKDPVLPSATGTDKGTKKLHLGRDHNPKYRLALLEVEQVRLKQIKEETLAGITDHLKELKVLWADLKSRRGLLEAAEAKLIRIERKKLFGDFFDAVHEASLLEAVFQEYHLLNKEK